MKQPWRFSSLVSKLIRPNGKRVKVEITSPERYVALATDRMEKVQKMITNSLQINHEICEYLSNRKLLLAIQSAIQCIQTFPPVLIESWRETFKLLFRLANEVESFTLACCNDGWIQHAIMFTDTTQKVISEYAFSLALELDLCEDFFRNPLEFAQFRTELAQDECDIVNRAATNDCHRSLEKVKALIASNDRSTPEWELASYLLGRLTTADPSMLIHGSAESSSYHFWEVDYDSLEQLQQLGGGATGQVHKTVWLGELVAEKTFFGSDHPSFMTEVSVLAGLSHPHNVPMFCYAMDSRRCSIVMELMDGDLFHLMQSRLRSDKTLHCPFTIPEAVDIMLQVAKGVNYLHEHGVVHRDLKSHNILVKSRKDVEYIYVKVADFGLSKTRETSSTFSNQSLNMGTTRWMAPEVMSPQGVPSQLASSSNPDGVKKYPFKCDIYSFAMVCYEVLTGEVPFQRTTSPSDVKRMVLEGHRPSVPNSCPVSLKTLIQSCWQSDASSRPSMGAIYADLKQMKWSLMTGKKLERHLERSRGKELERHLERPRGKELEQHLERSLAIYTVPDYGSTLLARGLPPGTQPPSGGRRLDGGIMMRPGYKGPTVNIRAPKWQDNTFWIRADNYPEAQFIADAVYYLTGREPFHFCDVNIQYPPLRLSATRELLTREACAAYVESIAKGAALQKQREDYRERVKEFVLRAVKSSEAVLFLSSLRSGARSVPNIDAAAEVVGNNVGDEFAEQESPMEVDDVSELAVQSVSTDSTGGLALISSDLKNYLSTLDKEEEELWKAMGSSDWMPWRAQCEVTSLTVE